MNGRILAEGSTVRMTPLDADGNPSGEPIIIRNATVRITRPKLPERSPMKPWIVRFNLRRERERQPTEVGYEDCPPPTANVRIEWADEDACTCAEPQPAPFDVFGMYDMCGRCNRRPVGRMRS